MMRLADADLLPVDYSPQAEAIAKYEAELEKLLKDKQDEFSRAQLAAAGRRLCRDGGPSQTLRAAAGPEIVPPYMNFAPMKNADRSAQEERRALFQDALGNWQAKGSPALWPRRPWTCSTPTF